MWRGLEKKSIKARATDKGGQASLSSRPDPASSAASARLTCHQGWRLSRAPLCCVGNCSSPGGRGEGAAKRSETQPQDLRPPDPGANGSAKGLERGLPG